GFKVAATGNVLIDSIEVSGKRQYNFEQSNVHDFAWFAYNKFIIDHKDMILPDGDTIRLSVFSNPDIRMHADVFNIMETTILQYGNKVGKYPYKTCKVVVGPLEAGAGMEYPTITICKNFDERALVHEIGHNWFYGALGTNERLYPWMDESINSFFEAEVCHLLSPAFSKDIDRDKHFYSPLDGKSGQFMHYEYKILKYNVLQGENQAINLPSIEYTENNYGLMIYLKGKLAFAYLKECLGDEMFYKCFKNYFLEFKFKHPLPGDMQNSFEQTYGKSLEWFFKDLLSDVNEVDYKYKRNGGKIKGPESIKTFLKSRIAFGEQFNPYGFLFERNLYNNGQKKQFMKLSFPISIPTYNRQVQVNLLPFVGYNIYDGLYPFLSISNSNLNDRSIEYMLMPAYTFLEDRFVGYGKLSYKHILKKKRGFIQGGVQGQIFGIELNENIRYYRWTPFIQWQSYSGKPGRTKVSNLWRLQYVNTGLDRLNYIEYQDSLGIAHFKNYSKDYFFNYLNLKFKKVIHFQTNKITWESNAEYASNSQFEPGSVAYFKIWTDLKYTFTYKKNRRFNSEFFAGYFPYKKGNFQNQAFYISGNSGYQDYMYSEAMIGRAENYTSDLLIGKQLINRGGLRQLIGLQGSDYWMLTWRNDIDFPGKLPISFYFDIGYYKYLNIVNTPNGKQTNFKNELCYTTGIQLNVIKGVLEIFLPVLVSENFKQFNLLNTSIMNTIGFKLNLNVFEPSKLMNSVTTSGKVKFED
ncbi:MAG: hypothetical protein IT245_09265, partial [Bacteroidia bacterium]|nr:hypothetical protein [Bacteroidia bacterium]